MITEQQVHFEPQVQPTPIHTLERADTGQLDRVRRRILRDLEMLQSDLRVVEHAQRQRRSGVEALEDGSYVWEVVICGGQRRQGCRKGCGSGVGPGHGVRLSHYQVDGDGRKRRQSVTREAERLGIERPVGMSLDGVASQAVARASARELTRARDDSRPSVDPEDES
jgi:hypothetical protein